MFEILLRKTRSVIRMGGPRRRLVAEAAVWLALARIALRVFPFRTIAAHLGQSLPPAEGLARMAAVPTIDEAPALVREISWAVRRTADSLPIGAVCLQQALAAKYMLRRRGITGALHLGVATRQGPGGAMTAHAWLDAAGVKVTGYPVTSEYTEVACFV